jgi:sugar lactone lactonase YvrE
LSDIATSGAGGRASNAELVWQIDPSGLAETPVWDAAHRRVLFADLNGGTIFGYGVDDGHRTVWELGERIGSLGLCRSGQLVVALARRVGRYDLETSVLTELTAEIDEPRGNYFNDGKVGPDGCFWVGTRDRRRDGGLDVEKPNGVLYRVSGDGRVEAKASGYLASNGLAWSPGGDILYHSDSSKRYVEAWPFDPTTGDLGDRRILVSAEPGADFRPDGAATDVDGGYWTALVRSGRVDRYGPDGRRTATLDLPCSRPTMPCFADQWLFVTSLRGTGEHLDVPGLFKMPAPVLGAPVGVFEDLR